MLWQTTASILALVFAAVSLVLTYRLSRRGAVVGKQPVVIFEYDPAAGWKIRNVGNGPALTVSIWLRDEASNWSHESRVPALSKDSELPLDWVGDVDTHMIGATYSDCDGREYTSVNHDATALGTSEAFSPRPKEMAAGFRRAAAGEGVDRRVGMPRAA